MSYSLAIYYATMTGNAEMLARRAYDRAVAGGSAARLVNLSEVKPADLAAESLALFVVSTWGDGEPPADACDFHYDLEKESAPALPSLRFAILGLGDKDYPEFNAFARKLDERLVSLGARRLHDRVEADLDFEETYADWENRVLPLVTDAALSAPVSSA
jgi:sulfite reductase (NADPH) flavoprotein alpha-component